uniref:Uncharacterized protein n=1 Tax=Pipistrellus kuhlii TaxID=59472 RepID=A0A7J7V0J4_PIPKU|nr:hypothetical protein mPipKuh1_008644 [Pipistrellus kuhlii]
MSLRGGCHTWPNYTIHFYAGLQHMEDSSVSLSPIMLASVVIGFIITISCFFIILVSVYPKKPWDPPRRHRHYWGDPQDGQDSQERPRCRGGVHCTCGLRGDRLAPSGCSHQDAPPRTERNPVKGSAAPEASGSAWSRDLVYKQFCHLWFTCTVFCFLFCFFFKQKIYICPLYCIALYALQG